ncbi:MAG TPA: spermidine synthase [Thermoleophilia bacterium]|nr:spermidine synthase [Thermoleophilia bacterium]
MVERGDGRSGELALLRRGDELQIVCNGAFVIASSNERSSRALIAAARPYLPDRPLDVLIGGLGMGYALDEALDLPALRGVTLAEYEPLIVEWFTTHMRERAARVERDARSRIVVADVRDLLAGGARYDLIALDTDNGPRWLIRAGNAGLYEADGLRQTASVVRPDGVVVFWSPERYAAFESALEGAFGAVSAAPARDVVEGRPIDYVMYVCREPRPAGSEVRAVAGECGPV